MRLVLFQPDIAQNVGTLIRLSACMAVALDIIEPCGFVWSDRKLKRSMMDYADMASVTMHLSWEVFQQTVKGRVIALAPQADQVYTDFTFFCDDALLLGQESVGLPDYCLKEAYTTLAIPMAPQRRSLNVALSGAMVLGEALRQTHLFPNLCN